MLHVFRNLKRQVSVSRNPLVDICREFVTTLRSFVRQHNITVQKCHALFEETMSNHSMRRWPDQHDVIACHQNSVTLQHAATTRSAWGRGHSMSPHHVTLQHAAKTRSAWRLTVLSNTGWRHSMWSKIKSWSFMQCNTHTHTHTQFQFFISPPTFARR